MKSNSEGLMIDGIVSYIDRDNIDTDQIIPTEYLKSIKKFGYEDYLFDGWRYKDDGKLGIKKEDRDINEDFILNNKPYTESKILLGRDNFGCGSSREHAPWALLDFGITCVISSSFADIFFNNCFKNGILPIILDEDKIKELSEYAKRKEEISVDLNEEKIILGEWFPDKGKGRIVSVVVLDSLPDKKRGTKIAEQLQSKYSKVCLATKQGLLIDGELASPGNFASYHGLQAALCEPGVNAVVLEIEASDLITNGLGVDRCDLAVFAAQEESNDRQLAEAARGILATISECVIDNSIIREGQNASLDAKQLAREINSNLS